MALRENKALMNVTESGKLKELEDTFLISEKCVDNESFPNEDESLSPRSFSVLFELTGGHPQSLLSCTSS
ncbi:Extracellular ligand-binding receptor [Artemisia annua]|uniref:Extracellular ligand-binding receptor n=1 Tax=Artemisia annua TaxID=35608 RepID=A0A2U1N3N6_ARTAN|nr:Extracellular ligand-binding receptor [Artemisia annua]